MNLIPLGDRAWLAAMPDEASAIRFTHVVRELNPNWLEDVVPAYSTVGVFYNDHISSNAVEKWLRELKVSSKSKAETGRAITIPVCYEHGADLNLVSKLLGRSTDEVISLHGSKSFTVYAIGFVPGFPYLGYLPKELTGVPRLASPRVRVEPGSVGITGKQTGIYPLERPGGWHLIGQTPLVLVDVADRFFPIRVGDAVRFTRIDEAEYTRLQGQRLPVNSPSNSVAS